MEEVSIKTITDYFTKAVKEQIPVTPSLWLDGAIKITALMGSLDDELIEAEMFVNKFVADRIEQGDTAAKAKILSQAKDEYGAFLKLKAERERIEQFIMLAKKRCSLQSFDQ